VKLPVVQAAKCDVRRLSDEVASCFLVTTQEVDDIAGPRCRTICSMFSRVLLRRHPCRTIAHSQYYISGLFPPTSTGRAPGTLSFLEDLRGLVFTGRPPWICADWKTSRDPVLPSTTASSGRHPILQSTAVLTLIVVASLSLIVGAIYMLIYFKSIKPMSARSRNYMQATASGAIVGGGGGGKPTDDDGGRARSTHPIFRRS